MKEIYAIKCDSCGYLHNSISTIRTCGFCEQEGCVDCVRHYTTKKGLLNTWFHIKNTSNYGESCQTAFHKGCEDRGIDPFL